MIGAGLRHSIVLKSCVFVVSTLLLLEMSARVIYESPTLAPMLLDSDSASWKRRWVERSRSPSGLGVLHAFDRFHPVRGWASVPNYRGTHWRDRLVTTNSLGLRGTAEPAIPKPPDTFRVVVLGDSFTFGEEVADRETYPSLLNDRLAGAEVLNLGVHGYGHDQMTLLFEELAEDLDPDVVVLGFVRMDMGRNLLSFRDYAKPYFGIGWDGRMHLRGVPVPEPDAVLSAHRARWRLADLFDVASLRIRRATGVLSRQRREITARILDRLAERIRGSGARGLFVYLPSLPEIHQDPELRRRTTFFDEHCPPVETIACENALPFFDRALERGTVFARSGHWRAAGHRVAAQAIESILGSRGWIPSGSRPERTSGDASAGWPAR